MGKCPEPGEPGFSEAGFLIFGVNVGLQLAREVGLGIDLVNALEERFPFIERKFAGELAGIVGQGVKAAVELTGGAPNAAIDPQAVPRIGPGAFTAAAEEERFLIRGTVGWQDEDGTMRWNTYNVFATEADTVSDLVKMIRDAFVIDWKRYEGKSGPDEPDWSDFQISFWFLGSKF